jgi:hypothetical protein
MTKEPIDGSPCEWCPKWVLASGCHEEWTQASALRGLPVCAVGGGTCCPTSLWKSTHGTVFSMLCAFSQGPCSHSGASVQVVGQAWTLLHSGEQ